MTALNWIKDKATATTDEPLEVEGVVYNVERRVFSGRLPYRMIREAAKSSLISTETELETLRVNLKTGYTEYSHTIYTPAAA